MHSASTTQAPSTAALPAAVLVAYVERIEATALVRQYVKLGPAEVDAFLAVVYFWALAGAPAGPFELPLARLRERLGNPSKNTVKAALAGLVGAHLLDMVTTSQSRAEATLVALGPAPGPALVAKLAAVWGQKLTPNPPREPGQKSTPTVRERGQYLTPAPASLGSDIDTSRTGSGQILTPAAPVNTDNAPENQVVTADLRSSTEPARDNFGHSSKVLVGNESVQTPTDKTKLPAKRRKKGDDDFDPAIVASFGRFWELYGIDGRKLDRAECLPVWAALTEADRAAIFEVVEQYVAYHKARPDSRNGGAITDFRPYPQRFLRLRRWEPFTDALKARSPNVTPNQPAPTNKQARRAGAAGDVPQHLTGYGID